MTGLADSNPSSDPQERIERFGHLLSEIEIHARAILDGNSEDIPASMIAMKLAYDEAWQITVEVSREALDKVVNEGEQKMRP